MRSCCWSTVAIGVQGEASRTVADGARLRATVTYEAHVQSVELAGDVRLDAPSRRALERALEGLPRDARHDAFAGRVAAADAALAAVDADDVAGVVRDAMR